jgi:type II pantothenate kinase
MSTLAVDFGGTTTDVILDQARRESALSLGAHDYPATPESLSAILAQLPDPAPAVIAVTGGRSRFLPADLDGIPIRPVNELQAVGVGGAAYTDGDALIVSMGTGTAIVRRRAGMFDHIGGTGIGGGTIMALGKLLLGADRFGEIEDLAAAGDLRRIDLSVGDIVGGDLGWLKSELVAANFGKLPRNTDYDRPDLAIGLLNLVGQAVSFMAIHLAHAQGIDRIVVIGRVIESPVMQRIFREAGETLGMTFVFPAEARFAVARGALRIVRDSVSEG